MKRILFLLIAVTASTPILFAQTEQKVSSSAVTFKIKNMGINTEGKFEGLKAAISFDKNNLDKSSIEASVDTKTLNSDNSMRDNHLKKEEYFDVEKFPEIKMKSVSFKSLKADNFAGVFDVTIKSKTKRIQVPFTYTENGDKSMFKGNFTISRTDFDIGGKSMVLANNADVAIVVETVK